MSEVVQFGPRELWLVSEGAWTLPVYCDPYTDNGHDHTHWAVRPAVSLLASPFAELSRIFAPQNLGTSSTYWIIAVGQLEKSAKRAQGCMPRDYLRWEGESHGKEMGDKETIGVNDKENEFLNFCCDRSSIDRPLGRYIWKAIKDGMMHWLINNQKPINFELFTIHPMPFRANWKEIMLARHPACPRIFKKKKALWRDGLVKCDFLQDLGSSDLMAVRSNKSFAWSLEIQPHKLLLDQWEEAESDRMTTKRPVKYAKYYESCLRRRLDDILDVFSTWIQQIQLSVGAVRESPVSCSPIIVPVSRRRRVLPKWHRPHEVTFQPAHDYPVLRQGHRYPRGMGKKIKDMLSLPDIQPGTEDVRDSGQQQLLDGPGHNGNGASGVLVLDAVEVETKISPVLAVGERS